MTDYWDREKLYKQLTGPLWSLFDRIGDPRTDDMLMLFGSIEPFKSITYIWVFVE